LALYSFLKFPDDFERTVLIATNIDEDYDSVTSIAGAISGAYLGVKTIPEKLKQPLENKNMIIAVANDLYEVKGNIRLKHCL